MTRYARVFRKAVHGGPSSHWNNLWKRAWRLKENGTATSRCVPGVSATGEGPWFCPFEGPRTKAGFRATGWQTRSASGCGNLGATRRIQHLFRSISTGGNGGSSRAGYFRGKAVVMTDGLSDPEQDRIV